MHKIRAAGEITILCERKNKAHKKRGCRNPVLLDSLVFVPQQIPDGVADDFEPTQVATCVVKCPSCETDIGFTITVTPTKTGAIEDGEFDVSTDGCKTIESEDDIRGMIVIE